MGGRAMKKSSTTRQRPIGWPLASTPLSDIFCSVYMRNRAELIRKSWTYWLISSYRSTPELIKQPTEENQVTLEATARSFPPVSSVWTRSVGLIVCLHCLTWATLAGDNARNEGSGAGDPTSESLSRTFFFPFCGTIKQPIDPPQRALFSLFDANVAWNVTGTSASWSSSSHEVSGVAHGPEPPER